ncbi:MAG: hypothetical protein MN733_30130 [Nitrososphaera sp.]|nr:hypothetical protein [Nitrososphaera sp.]
MQWSSDLYISYLFNAYTQSIVERMQARINEMAFNFHDFELTNFFAWLEATRERKFYRIPLSMPIGFTGAWFTDEEFPYEYIIFNGILPTSEQQFIQLHEASHFLCGHQTVRISGDRLRRWINALRSHSGRLYLRQGHPERILREEIEAEALAILIQRRACVEQHITHV